MCTGKKNKQKQQEQEKEQEQEKICQTWVLTIGDCAAAQSPNYNIIPLKDTFS